MNSCNQKIDLSLVQSSTVSPMAPSDNQGQTAADHFRGSSDITGTKRIKTTIFEKQLPSPRANKAYVVKLHHKVGGRREAMGMFYILLAPNRPPASIVMRDGLSP